MNRFIIVLIVAGLIGLWVGCTVQSTPPQPHTPSEHGLYYFKDNGLCFGAKDSNTADGHIVTSITYIGPSFAGSSAIMECQ